MPNENQNQPTPEEIARAYKIAQLKDQWRKGKENDTFFYKASLGISPNSLKYPNPRTIGEKRKYQKLSEEACNQWQRAERELKELGETPY